MALKDTIAALKKHAQDLQRDLEKATAGVKAASQRVRIGTIKLAKIAKLYRKESIAFEKSSKKKSPAKKSVKKPKAAPRTKKATAKLPQKKK